MVKKTLAQRTMEVLRDEVSYTSKDYIAGVFDCLDMCIISFLKLKEREIKSHLCIGFDDNEIKGHAWLELDHTDLEIEATYKTVNRRFNRVFFYNQFRRYSDIESFKGALKELCSERRVSEYLERIQSLENKY